MTDPSLPTQRHIRSNPTSIFLLVQNELSSSGWPRKCVPAPFSFPSPVPPLSANRSWSSASRGSVLLWVPVWIVCMSLAKGEKKILFMKKKYLQSVCFFSPLSLPLSFVLSQFACCRMERKFPNVLMVNPSAVQQIHVSESFDSSGPETLVNRPAEVRRRGLSSTRRWRLFGKRREHKHPSKLQPSQTPEPNFWERVVLALSKQCGWASRTPGRACNRRARVFPQLW